MQGRIVINPQVLSDERDALAVAYNEAYRAVMEMQNFVPQAEPTPEQIQFFADTAYANDPLMMKRTIVARIATYDTSIPNPTPEQYMDTVNMLHMVQEAGVIQTPEEEEIVSSTLADMEQNANAPAQMTPAPEEPVEAMAPDMAGEMPVDALPPDANAAGAQLPPELMAMLGGGAPAPEGIPVRSADGAGNVEDPDDKPRPGAYSTLSYDSGVGDITLDDTNSVEKVMGDQPVVQMTDGDITALKEKYGDDWVKVAGRAAKKDQTNYSNDRKAAQDQVAGAFKPFTTGLTRQKDSNSSVDLGLGDPLGKADADTINTNVAAWAVGKSEQDIVNAYNLASKAMAANEINGLYTDDQRKGWMQATVDALHGALKQRSDILKAGLKERLTEDTNEAKALQDLATELGVDQKTLGEYVALTDIVSGEDFDKRRDARNAKMEELGKVKADLEAKRAAALDEYNKKVTEYNTMADNNATALKATYDSLMSSNRLTEEQKEKVRKTYEAATNREASIDTTKNETFNVIDDAGNITNDPSRLADLDKASGAYATRLSNRTTAAKDAADWLKQAATSLDAIDQWRELTTGAHKQRFGNELNGAKVHALLTGRGQMRKYIDDNTTSLGEAAALYVAAADNAGNTDLSWYEGIDDDAEKYMEDMYDYFNNKADELGFSDWNNTFAGVSGVTAAYEFAKHLSKEDQLKFLKFAAASELVGKHNWGKSSGGRKRAIESIANVIASQANSQYAAAVKHLQVPKPQG